jgi:hypothetical protein
VNSDIERKCGPARTSHEHLSNHEFKKNPFDKEKCREAVMDSGNMAVLSVVSLLTAIAEIQSFSPDYRKT